MHIKYAKRDKELQDRVVDQYIKKLDPSKINFLASDVEDLKKSFSNIFDNIKKKDCSTLEKADKLLLTRMTERAEFAKKTLDEGYKFDPKTEFVFDPQKKAYPATKAEAEEFLKKYIHFQISNNLAADQKMDESRANVKKSWARNLKRLQDEKQDDNYSLYLDSFALALDPHSSYFSRDVNEDFRIQMSLSLEGIGATLSSQDGFTVIESLVPGGAAARSGQLQSQDKIIAVGQKKDGALENVIEMDLKDVVRKIRGDKGTEVRLLVLRKKGDTSEKFEVVLIRDKVKLEDDAASVHYTEKEINGTKKKIAILDLPSFYSDSRHGGRSAATDLKKLIDDLKKNKAEGVVLDFSNNGGGSLDDAVKIAGLFFAAGNVVKQSSREEGKGEITLRDTDKEVNWAGPMVVLTSRISASASEIVAGTLKDYKRAVIVGSEHTFGKGSVQQVVEMPPGSGELGAVKVTVGMFFTPGGFSTQHRGVEADVKIPSQFDHDDIGEKYLDYSLPPKQLPPFLSPEALGGSAKETSSAGTEKAEGSGLLSKIFSSNSSAAPVPSEATLKEDSTSAWKMIKPDWVAKLSEKSKLRVDKSDEFKKIVTELNKEKARGKLIKVSEAVKDKEKRESRKAIKNAKKEDKEQEYMKRADVQEAANVLADLMSLETVEKAK
jgi:carboxyl-terminal processing protease